MTNSNIITPKDIATVSVLAFAIVCSILIVSQPPVYAQQQSSKSFTANLTGKDEVPPVNHQSFTANLTGKDEVPPVNTQATGMAQFQLIYEGSEFAILIPTLHYNLTTSNLNGFMMAYIHEGKAGENGTPVVALHMGKGKITSSDLQGPLAGKLLYDLIDVMKNGGAYVNVHTQQNQNGEIRGQITSGNSG